MTWCKSNIHRGFQPFSSQNPLQIKTFAIRIFASGEKTKKQIQPHQLRARHTLMKTIKHVFVIALALVLSACASYRPVPEGYSGPVAVIRDSAQTESVAKGQLFYVQSIDGNAIHNARNATRQSSANTGFIVNARDSERRVPIRAMKLRLIATHVTGAPIHELASRAAGTFFSVEGDVEFTPKAGATYVVRGELKKGASSVWIEDATSQAIEPGTKIEGK
jgi:hypothetical protein